MGWNSALLLEELESDNVVVRVVRPGEDEQEVLEVARQQLAASPDGVVVAVDEAVVPAHAMGRQPTAIPAAETPVVVTSRPGVGTLMVEITLGGGDQSDDHRTRTGPHQ